MELQLLCHLEVNDYFDKAEEAWRSGISARIRVCVCVYVCSLVQFSFVKFNLVYFSLITSVQICLVQFISV